MGILTYPGFVASPHTRSRTLETTGLLAALRDRWSIVLLSTIFALTAALAALSVTDEQYETTASFYVAAVPAPDQSPYNAGNYVETRAESYARIIEGRAFSRSVAERLAIPVGEYPQFAASVESGTALLQMTVVDVDPARALAAAEAAVELLPELATTLDPGAVGGAAPIRVQPVELPELPRTPVSPNVVLHVGSALVLGTLLGIGGALLLARSDVLLRRPQDLQRLDDPPVVLGLVGVREKVDSTESWAEAFQTIFARLLYYSPTSPRIVLVTSSVLGEGKTLVATELAKAAARSGQRVLVLGCDLRRPSLGTALGVPDGLGVAGALAHERPLRSVIEPTSVRGLDVLPAGPPMDNPLRVLRAPAFEAALDDLAEEYDLVVLDAPPVLPVADAALLASKADATVVVARPKRVGLDQVASAHEQLARAGAVVVGTVLNGVRRADLAEFATQYVLSPRRVPPTAVPEESSERAAREDLSRDDDREQSLLEALTPTGVTSRRDSDDR